MKARTRLRRLDGLLMAYLDTLTRRPTITERVEDGETYL